MFKFKELGVGHYTIPGRTEQRHHKVAERLYKYPSRCKHSNPADAELMQNVT